MVPGFNHNIKHGGQIYHVQTEDSGVSNPHIITHLFVGGNILATKKTSYADIVNAENLQDIVKELMQEQHKAMLRNLINGVYDDIASASSPVSPQAIPLGTEPPLPEKFPSPIGDRDQAPPTKPSQPSLEPAQVEERKTQPAQAMASKTPKSPATATMRLPKVVPTPVPRSQTNPSTQASTKAQPMPTRAQAPVTPEPQQSEAKTVQLPKLQIEQSQQTSQAQDTASSPNSKPPMITTGSSGGFSRPKTSPKIFLPKDLEKVPPSQSSKPRVAIQVNNPKKAPDKTPADTSAALPPEVLAARRLSEKPKPKDTSGPTIFGENLISEKSLDEVILGYLAGNDDDKG